MDSSNWFPVDFNNCDVDGAVRLTTRGALAYKEENDIEFKEGGEVEISDGELYAKALLKHRDGIWVAVVCEWLEK